MTDSSSSSSSSQTTGVSYFDNNSTSNDDDTQPVETELIASEEETISAYFVLFSALLAVVLIFSKLLHDRPRISSFVPEAGMILITGVVFGALIEMLFVGQSSTQSSNQYQFAGGNDNSNNPDDSGGGAEGEDSVAVSLLSFSPEVFFLVLLPPIIFNSGYHLRKELFFRHLTPICLYAVLGTLISALVIAMLLQLICQHLLKESGGFDPTFTELLTFGALLSATDPVSTLAVFQVKRVDPKLFYLVFGESVLNDAVSLVLFNAFQDFVVRDNGAGKVAVGMSEFFLGFLYDSIGSPVLGIFFGLATAWMFKHIDFRSTRLLELSLFILIMYVPFLLAQLLALSGIVTILFSGLAAKAYVVPNLSVATAEHADVLIRLASHLAETAIFLELGLSVSGLTGSIHVAFIVWTIVVSLIARAANVYPITYLYNKTLQQHRDIMDVPPRLSPSTSSTRPTIENPKATASNPNGPSGVELTNLPLNDLAKGNSKDTQNQPTDPVEKQLSSTPPAVTSMAAPLNDSDVNGDDLTIAPNTAHMVWFSGLRGAVAYACVRSFPDTFGHADEFTMTTMILVLVSVFGLGSTTECMLNVLRIQMNADEDLYMERQPDPAASSSLSWIRQWEDRLYRFVVRGASGGTIGHIAIRDTEEGHSGRSDDNGADRPITMRRSASTGGINVGSGELQHKNNINPSTGNFLSSLTTNELNLRQDSASSSNNNDQTSTPSSTSSPVDQFEDEGDEHDDDSISSPTRGGRQSFPRRESVFDYGAS